MVTDSGLSKKDNGNSAKEIHRKENQLSHLYLWFELYSINIFTI